MNAITIAPHCLTVRLLWTPDGTIWELTTIAIGARNDIRIPLARASRPQRSPIAAHAEAVAVRAKVEAWLRNQRPQCHRCGCLLPARKEHRQCSWSIAPPCAFHKRRRLIEAEFCHAGD